MWQLFGLIVLFCMGFSKQYSYIIHQNNQPGDTPYCVDSAEEKKIGEEWFDLEKCETRSCDSNPEGLAFISVNGCGAIWEPENVTCVLVKPTEAKSYPECCPHLECEETDTKNEQTEE